VLEASQLGIFGGDSGSVHAYEHLIGLRSRRGELFDRELLRRPVLAENNGLHDNGHANCERIGGPLRAGARQLRAGLFVSGALRLIADALAPRARYLTSEGLTLKRLRKVAANLLGFA